jgi:hypothetical protein
MNFEEPEGRATDDKELATWPTDTESTESDGEEPKGYIVVRRRIKKTYRVILSEEELL